MVVELQMDRFSSRNALVIVLAYAIEAGKLLCFLVTLQAVGGDQKKVRSTRSGIEVPLQGSWTYSLCDVGYPGEPHRPPNCSGVLQGYPISGSW